MYHDPVFCNTTFSYSLTLSLVLTATQKGWVHCHRRRLQLNSSSPRDERLNNDYDGRYYRVLVSFCCAENRGTSCSRRFLRVVLDIDSFEPNRAYPGYSNLSLLELLPTLVYFRRLYTRHTHRSYVDGADLNARVQYGTASRALGLVPPNWLEPRCRGATPGEDKGRRRRAARSKPLGRPARGDVRNERRVLEQRVMESTFM